MPTSGHRGRRWTLAGLAIAAVASVALAPPAGAHPFLVATDPAQGARLGTSPREVALEFSETVSRPRLSLATGPAGRPVDLPARLDAGGRVVRADLPAGWGVHLVRWEVVGTDGDGSSGQFAFAVGADTVAPPAGRSRSPARQPIDTGASWVFFTGLALTAGGIATALTGAVSRSVRPPGARLGLGVALTGATVAWGRAVGGLGSPAAPLRQQLLLAATVAFLAAALLATTTGRDWKLRARLVSAAAVAWAGRGHDAVVNGALGWFVDAAHLMAGATWAGALALLAATLWRDRKAGGDAGLADARAYARLAVVLVAVLASAGLGSAALLLRRPADLWSTGYGRLLMAKSAFFLAAVGVALAGRRALRRGGLGVLRRATPVEAAILVVVLALSAVLTGSALPAPGLGVALLGPPPLAGAVARDAGPAGILTVAVSAAGGQLQVEVLPPGGRPTRARARIDARPPDGRRLRLRPRPCGPGCFIQRLQLSEGETAVEVDAAAPGWQGGRYTARLDWPPLPEDPRLLSRLVATLRAAPAVEVNEAASSGPFRLPPGPYPPMSGDAFLATEPYAAGSAGEIRPLTPDGRSFRLYFPGDRVWITLWLDVSGRPARERVVSIGHLLERTFRYPPG